LGGVEPEHPIALTRGNKPANVDWIPRGLAPSMRTVGELYRPGSGYSNYRNGEMWLPVEAVIG
jgi:hypothetical protein